MKKEDLESGRDIQTDNALAFSGRFKTPSLNVETLDQIPHEPPMFNMHERDKSELNGDLK